MEQRLPKGLVFNFRDTDTPKGVCRESLRALAERSGMSETQYIHTVLAQHLATENAVLDETLPDVEYLRLRNAQFRRDFGETRIAASFPGLLAE